MKSYLEHKGKWVFDKIVDVKAILKSDSRIASDVEYSDLVNLTNRTQETIVTSLMGTPLDEEYPVFTAKTAAQPRWKKWLGLKSNDSPIRTLWKAFWSAFKDGLRGDASVVKDITTHFTVAGIAREQGYNKGRHRNPEKHGEDDTFQAKYVSREVRADVTQLDLARPDDTDKIETKMLYQQTIDIYKRMHKTDQLVIRTNILTITEKISFEAAYRHYEPEFHKVGISTCRGARKRLASLGSRYPELNHLRKAIKN